MQELLREYLESFFLELQEQKEIGRMSVKRTESFFLIKNNDDNLSYVLAISGYTQNTQRTLQEIIKGFGKYFTVWLMGDLWRDCAQFD